MTQAYGGGGAEGSRDQVVVREEAMTSRVESAEKGHM